MVGSTRICPPPVVHDTFTAVIPPRPALDSLDAFYLEHRLCGELDGRLEDGSDGQVRVWLACERCDVRMVREA